MTSTATTPVAGIQTRIAAAKKALSDAQAAYTATTAAIKQDLATHASAHQSVADAHLAEVKVANDLAGQLGEVGAVLAQSPQIVLTAVDSWYTKAKTWLQAKWHWLVGGPAAAIVGHYVIVNHLFGL